MTSYVDPFGDKCKGCDVVSSWDGTACGNGQFFPTYGNVRDLSRGVENGGKGECLTKS
jgi:hypothetical protein